MASKKPAPKTVPVRHYDVTITLQGPEPPIWRSLRVPECTFERLDGLIQAAMGWQGCHLSQFEAKGKVLGDPEALDDGFGGPKVKDWSTVTLADLKPTKGKRAVLVYTYDFGDDWRHEVVVAEAAEEGVDHPVCTGGARACPPEDVGGEPGYEELLEVLAGPKNKRREEMLEWLEAPFDPEAFSIEEANQRLRKRWKGMAGR